MQIDLSDREVQVILSALAEKKESYKSIRENPNGITAESAKKALEVIDSVEEKLEPEVPVLKPEDPSGPGGSSKAEGSSKPGRFLYVYVPDGIRDRELEEELASRIPETSDPEADNFFWSTKFNNFVVKAEFAEEAREAVRARYDGDVVLKKDPDWAKKPNTWQVIEKEDVRAPAESQKEGQGATPRPR